TNQEELDSGPGRMDQGKDFVAEVFRGVHVRKETHVSFEYDRLGFYGLASRLKESLVHAVVNHMNGGVRADGSKSLSIGLRDIQANIRSGKVPALHGFHLQEPLQDAQIPKPRLRSGEEPAILQHEVVNDVSQHRNC